MEPRGKKLGILLSAGPTQPNFDRALQLASVALTAGVDVYLYCIDDAVSGITALPVQKLKERGLKLYACAFAARQRKIPLNDAAVFAGLAVVHDLMARTDRFVSLS